MKRAVACLLALCLSFGSFAQTWACTGTIIGKNVSADQDPIIARTEDWSSNYNKIIQVHEVKTHKKGEMFKDEYGFTYPMPEKTYRYVSVPDGYQEEGDVFEATGWNEKGVTMTATVTASAHEKALEADPLPKDGIYESSIVSVILPQIKTAREGVKLLGKIMDTKGTQEGAIVVFADQKEIWYMELLTGHQYVAVKYPDDAYSVFPNCFMLGTVDVKDKENVIASENLVKLPQKHGFLVEEKGLIHIRKTYAEPLAQGNRDRLWGGINFLDPDKKIPYDAEEFELFQKTNKKISVKDVMEMQRYRYECTDKDGNLAENKGKVRPIGVTEQEECHIIQIKQKYPRELGGVLWVAMGNAEYAQYVPIIGPVKETIAPYQVMGNAYDPSSAYWTMRQVSALSGLDRDLYGKYVREYFNSQENRILQEMKETDKAIISAKKADDVLDIATKASLKEQQKAYDDAKLLAVELNNYFFDNSGDGVYKSDDEKKTPYIPSLLGEERKGKILEERGISQEETSSQPVDKNDTEAKPEENK